MQQEQTLTVQNAQSPRLVYSRDLLLKYSNCKKNEPELTALFSPVASPTSKSSFNNQKSPSQFRTPATVEKAPHLTETKPRADSLLSPPSNGKWRGPKPSVDPNTTGKRPVQAKKPEERRAPLTDLSKGHLSTSLASRNNTSNNTFSPSTSKDLKVFVNKENAASVSKTPDRKAKRHTIVVAPAPEAGISSTVSGVNVAAALDFAHAVVKANEKVVPKIVTDDDEGEESLEEPEPSTLSSPSGKSPRSPSSTMSPKSPKSSPKVIDDHQLEQRQKQIDYGHQTLGYLRYRLLVPKEKRGREDPRTPKKSQACSKRSWDGQVKKWRRDLHKWDPEDPTAFMAWLESDFVMTMIERNIGSDLIELIGQIKERAAKFENSPAPSPSPSPSGRSGHTVEDDDFEEDEKVARKLVF